MGMEFLHTGRTPTHDRDIRHTSGPMEPAEPGGVVAISGARRGALYGSDLRTEVELLERSMFDDRSAETTPLITSSRTDDYRQPSAVCHSRRRTSGYGTFDRSDYDAVDDDAVRDVRPELPASQFVLASVNDDRDLSTRRSRRVNNLIDFDSDVDTSTPLTVVHRRRETISRHSSPSDERRVSTDHRTKSVVQSVPAKQVKSVGTVKPAVTRHSSVVNSKPKPSHSSPEQTDTSRVTVMVTPSDCYRPLHRKPKVMWCDHSVDKKDDDLSFKNRRPVKQFNCKELPVGRRRDDIHVDDVANDVIETVHDVYADEVDCDACYYAQVYDDCDHLRRRDRHEPDIRTDSINKGHRSSSTVG